MLSEKRAIHFPIDLYPRISSDGKKTLDSVHVNCMYARYEEKVGGHRSHHQKYVAQNTNQTVIIIINLICIQLLFVFFFLIK